MQYAERQLREVFHLLFLERLLKLSDPDIYVLKGGVNLRFFFHSPRYSEDMDIDVLTGSVATLKKNGYKILRQPAFRRSLATCGIADLVINDPGKAKHTGTTQRFRCRLLTQSGESLPTNVEFSRRDTEAERSRTDPIDPQIAREYNRLAYRCRHYAGEAAVEQKIRALIGRDITQARDLFDLHILYLGGHCDKAMIGNTFSAAECETAVDHLSSLSHAAFEGQVLEFLEPEQRGAYASQTVWEGMKAEMLEVLSES